MKIENFIQSYLISMFAMIILWVIMIVVSTFFLDYSKYVIAFKGLVTIIFFLLSFLIVILAGFIKYEIEISVKKLKNLKKLNGIDFPDGWMLISNVRWRWYKARIKKFLHLKLKEKIK